MMGISVGRRLVAVLAVCALCAGVIACGSSDDDGGDASAASESSGATSAAADKDQIAALMSKLRTQFNSGDAAGYCDSLSPAGQRELVASGADFPSLEGKRPDCATVVRQYMRLVENGGGYTPVRVLKVDVNGDGTKGTVTSTGGLAGRGVTATVKVVKADGKWTIVDPISGPIETERPNQ